MKISESKMKVIIENYFQDECNINTTIHEAFEKGFRIGVKIAGHKEQTGKWFKMNNPNYSPFDGSGPYCYICSSCGFVAIREYAYCPNCGSSVAIREYAYCPKCGSKNEIDQKDDKDG